jgi:hypothetical protein
MIPSPAAAVAPPLREPDALPQAPRPPAPSPAGRVAWGLFFVAEALLAFAPLIVMAPATGWPASLGEPAALQLSKVAAAPQAVLLGYALYLLYSIAIGPLLIVLAARTWGSLAHPAAASVAAFATLSVLARAIGILRWLTVMPLLATAHAAADPADRAAIELVFTAITEWGGGIGEILGVSLFMALAVALLSIGAWQRRALPRPVAALGAASSLALALLLVPAFGGPELMPVAAAVTLLSVWLLAVGLVFIRR